MIRELEGNVINQRFLTPTMKIPVLNDNRSCLDGTRMHTLLKEVRSPRRKREKGEKQKAGGKAREITYYLIT